MPFQKNKKYSTPQKDKTNKKRKRSPDKSPSKEAGPIDPRSVEGSVHNKKFLLRKDNKLVNQGMLKIGVNQNNSIYEDQNKEKKFDFKKLN